MAPLCAILPQYVLEGIIEKGVAPQDIVNRCQSTIEKTKHLRDVREHHGQTIVALPQQQNFQGIIPPYILELIARNAGTEQQREAASHTLEHRAKYRIAAGRVRQLHRTVYDAYHQNDHPFRRDKFLIREGGDLLSQNADPTQNANECYVGLGKSYDFYFNFFQRNSINDAGFNLDGFVHAEDLYNAYWDDGIVFHGFTDELDVIGHEFSHGVNGALNEDFADAFGVMIKQWGEGSPQTVDQANWLIGEGHLGPSVKGRALRDMANPGTAYDDGQKDDSGGVHINSGIPNRAFFLAATKIGGYAWEGAGPIWYRALSSGKLPTDGKATFKQFTDLTIESAGEHVDKVREAWTAVGYPFPEKSHEL
ncbi:Peptidase M4 [Penicillium canescens]|nr:Peptidase M4 [Penicillium canescens]